MNAEDKRTAERTEYMCTKQQRCVVQRETTKTHPHGDEQWEGHCMVGRQEAPIISDTTARTLPHRVAIGCTPGRLATTVFISPTKIDNSAASGEDMPAGASMS